MPASHSDHVHAVRPGSLRAWLIALRLKSLLIAFSPVIVGTAMAWGEVRAFSPILFGLTLVSALMLQVVTNLQNDVGYTIRGADRDRSGVHVQRR